MTDVLDVALRVAADNGGKCVTKITLKIGLMSGVQAAYAQSFFEVISKGTIAARAELVIESEPAAFMCRRCGGRTVYESLGPDYLCSACGSGDLRLLAGRSFQIVNVGIR